MVALFLTALAVVLHVTFLTHAGALWRDEVNTINVATLPGLTDESTPSLPLALIHGWAVLVGPQNDFGLRVFGFIVGLAIITTLWFNALQISRRPPVWSLALLGFNPAFIRWGDSLRSNGLGTLFILLAFGLIWRAVESPTPRRLLLATLAALLSVQSLYSNAFLLAAIIAAGVLICGLTRQRKKAGLIVALGVAAALSVLPYLHQIQQANTLNALMQMSFSLERISTLFFQTAASAHPLMAWLWTALALLAVVIVSRLFLLKNNSSVEEKNRSLYGATVLISGTAAFVFFLMLARLETKIWYYLPLLALWAGSLEIILSPLAVKFPGWGLPVVMAILLFSPTRTSLLDHQTNMDQVSQILEKQAGKNDVILLAPWFYGVSFSRYYHGPARWLTIPNLADHLTHRYDLMKKRMMAERPIDDIFATVSEALQSGHRVWLVGLIRNPEPGESVPVLPPAPHSAYGWSSGAYDVTWALQTGAFIQTHARRSNSVNLPDQGSVMAFERPTLAVVEGWHN